MRKELTLGKFAREFIEDYCGPLWYNGNGIDWIETYNNARYTARVRTYRLIMLDGAVIEKAPASAVVEMEIDDE